MEMTSKKNRYAERSENDQCSLHLFKCMLSNYYHESKVLSAMWISVKKKTLVFRHSILNDQGHPEAEDWTMGKVLTWSYRRL